MEKHGEESGNQKKESSVNGEETTFFHLAKMIENKKTGKQQQRTSLTDPEY